MRIGPALRLGLVLGLAAGAPAQQSVPSTLIAKRCLSCHNGAQKMGGLSLESRESAIQGGSSGPALNTSDPLSSLLMKRVDSGQMPLGNPLPGAEREMLRSWLKEGAPWATPLRAAVRPKGDKTWWSLQPLKPLQEASIDQFLMAAMEKKGLEPSPPADARTLIRRVTFDLTGLPPTPEEVARFEADQRPVAYEELVDRLLASPAYGERWGRHWLDVARFGESSGYEQNHLRSNAWQYRDYVIRSLNADKPFDRMVLEQLAGDVVGRGDPEIEVATAFLVAGPHDTVGNQAEAARRQQRADDLDDMINATAAGFLGLTVNCARCHDHKFDPIRQADYYRLAAVFNGVVHTEREIATEVQRREHEAKVRPLEAELSSLRAALKQTAAGAREAMEAQRAQVLARYRPPVSPRGVEEKFAPTTARFVRLAATNGVPGGLDEFEVFDAAGSNVALASAGARIRATATRRPEANPEAYSERHLIDGKYDQRWFADGKTAEIVVELPKPARIMRAVWSSDRPGALMDSFQTGILREYVLELSQDGKRWTRVATSEGRLPPKKEEQDELVLLACVPPEKAAEYRQMKARAAALEADLKAAGKLPAVYAGRFEAPKEPVFLLKGGNVMQRGEAIVPASLTTLDHALPGFTVGEEIPESERRLALARWITHPLNPLAPRVIANRLWHYHFGRGIVGTPSDFGFNGERPTHPELLDYLAGRILHYGWRLKPLHREIVLSAAYRQSSVYNEEYARIDAESRYLWRFPPQRLSAEAIRDSILAVAGKLQSDSGGPGFRLYKYTVDNVATYLPLDKFGPETYRRSVYLQSARSIRPELLAQYDCPDSALPEPKRVVTTSPLQALSLLNNSFILDMSNAMAERVRNEAGPSPDEQIRRAFALAFVREPSAAETAAARKLADQHGLAALWRALLNANEFLYVM